MLSKIITKLTIFALRTKRLKGNHRMEVMSELLRNLNAFPTTTIIKEGADGTIMIKGKPLSYEDAKLFIESAQTLNDNYARKIFHEQVLYEAVKMGVHQGLTPEMIMFSKAAIWWGEQERTWATKFLKN